MNNNKKKFNCFVVIVIRKIKKVRKSIKVVL